jgi:hypothetical protein
MQTDRLTIEGLFHDGLDVRFLRREGFFEDGYVILGPTLKWPQIAHMRIARYRREHKPYEIVLNIQSRQPTQRSKARVEHFRILTGISVPTPSAHEVAPQTRRSWAGPTPSEDLFNGVTRRCAAYINRPKARLSSLDWDIITAACDGGRHLCADVTDWQLGDFGRNFPWRVV